MKFYFKFWVISIRIQYLDVMESIVNENKK